MQSFDISLCFQYLSILLSACKSFFLYPFFYFVLILIQFIFLGRLLFTYWDECQIHISMQSSSNSNKKTLRAKVCVKISLLVHSSKLKKIVRKCFCSSEKWEIIDYPSKQYNQLFISSRSGRDGSSLFLKCFWRGLLLKGFHHVHLYWRHPFLF